MAEQTIPSNVTSLPSRGRSRVLILAVGTAILIAVFTLVWLQSAKYEPLAVGKPAPDFSLTDLNDKQYRLSDFRGKVVSLNFWATWCKPCREEMPSMEILNKKTGPFTLIDGGRSGKRGPKPPRGRQSHGSMMERFEERWRRRRDQNGF